MKIIKNDGAGTTLGLEINKINDNFDELDGLNKIRQQDAMLINKGFQTTDSLLEENYIAALHWIKAFEVYSDSDNRYMITEFRTNTDGTKIHVLRIKLVSDPTILFEQWDLPLSGRKIINLNGDVVILDYAENEKPLFINSALSPIISGNPKRNRFYDFAKLEQHSITSVIEHENDCVKKANVKWVDGNIGILTYDNWDEGYGAFLSWVVTHPLVDVSQPPITVVNGNISIIPEKVLTFK